MAALPFITRPHIYPLGPLMKADPRLLSVRRPDSPCTWKSSFILSYVLGLFCFFIGFATLKIRD